MARILSEATYQRLQDAADYIETHQGQPPRRRTRSPGTANIEPIAVRCTSGTPNGDGLYPGMITRWEPDTATWTDFAAVNLLPPNGETLVSGTRYATMPVGTRSGTDVYQVLQGVGGGATFSGARLTRPVNLFTVPNNALTTLTFDNRDYDAGGYTSGASPWSGFAVPTGGGGKFLVTCNIYWGGGFPAGTKIETRLQLPSSNYSRIQNQTAETAITTPTNEHNLIWVGALNAGDGVAVQVLQTSGGNWLLGGNIFVDLAITKLG